MNELITNAIQIATNQYGNRGSDQARRLHAAVLLMRAAQELGRMVREQTSDQELRNAMAEAVAAYPTTKEIDSAVGLQ
jgi:hypothetical protein